VGDWGTLTYTYTPTHTHKKDAAGARLRPRRRLVGDWGACLRDALGRQPLLPRKSRAGGTQGAEEEADLLEAPFGALCLAPQGAADEVYILFVGIYILFVGIRLLEFVCCVMVYIVDWNSYAAAADVYR
jgi:hypothetical protein